MSLKTAACWIGCILLAGKGLAADSTTANTPEDGSNPFSVISERNVFHLNPIPPPDPVPDAPKPDLPVIKLSGFFKVGLTVRAYFSSVPKDKKTEPAYYSLTEGEKSSDSVLEVVKIHQDAGEVEIINSGTPMTLSLKDDTLAPKETAPKAAEPAHRAPPMPGTMPNAWPGFGAKSQPGMSPTPSPQPPANGGTSPFAFPMRPRRTPVPQ